MLPKLPCCREQKTKQGRGQSRAEDKSRGQSRAEQRRAADTHSGETAEGALALKIEHEVPCSSKHRPH